MAFISRHVSCRFIFVLSFFLSSIFVPLEAQRCFDDERDALLEFKRGLQDPSDKLSSWTDSTDCCTWTGVVCNETGRVTGLDLGASPVYSDSSGADNRCLSGLLSDSLRGLGFLSYLDLKNNDFSGLGIPEFIGSLKRLSHLDLSNASFSGLVPSQIASLSNLQYLNLSQSPSENDLWVEDLNWISGLTSLNSLDLSNVNLSKASGEWLDAVNALPYLVELRLSNCQIREIPQSLGFVNITSLKFLDLSNNQFNTLVPKWLHNITSLEHLKLERCGLEGNVSELVGKDSCNLRILEAAFNELGGDVESLVEKFALCANKTLEWLDLNANRINGTLPDTLVSLENLVYVSLSNNLMSGPIPESIGNLSHLSVLSLHSNSFKGVISEAHFHNLRNLRNLSLSSVNASLVFSISRDWKPPFLGLAALRVTECALGPSFPTWLSTQTKLSELALLRTRIVDTVPDFLWNLAPSLRLLDLSGNQLHGTLDRSLSFYPDAEVYLGDNLFEGLLPTWSNIGMFALRNNMFSGTIPSTFHLGLSNLIFLDLSGNFLTGEIPSSIRALRQLKYLDLSDNNFSGSMYRSWEGLDELHVFDVSINNLSGQLPRNLCLEMPSLRWFKLSDNSVSGDLSWLRNCTKMSTLDLKQNKFHGSIPEHIAEELPNLMELVLRDNEISGKIPEGICQLSLLHILDLAVNNLSGLVPSCIGDLAALKVLSSYQPVNAVDMPLGEKIWDWIVEGKQMELVVKGRSAVYRDMAQIVNIIDLSANHLTGMIPEEITELKTLGFLNLSWNQLTGPLPDIIGNLSQLETLDVSCNRLSGIIPPSMTSMTLLDHLNLSHNNFSGVIPRSNQFATFNDPSIYEGNPGLCGPPLFVNCIAARGGDRTVQDDNDDEDDNDMVWMYMGMAIGAATGFWAVCGTLMIKKSWRESYFAHADRFLGTLGRTTSFTSGLQIQQKLTTGTSISRRPTSRAVRK